jgi:beta-glucanase (GH16 family)
MKKITVFVFSLLFMCITESYALPPAAAGYGLAWSDEFNDTSLDTINNWSYDTTFINSAAQAHYTRSCVTVENGRLVIWTKFNPNEPARRYTSGKIDSHDKKIFTYGYFEASIKAPLGQVSGPGLWSCVWLFGNSMWHTIAWPSCGEMQLYEQRPSNALMRANSPQPVPPTVGDNEFIASCHYGVNSSPSYHSLQYNYPSALSDRFHTYGLFWDSLHAEYYFDDTLFWGVDFPIVNGTNFGVPSITLPENFTTFHSPFSWVINVEVGGAYQGQNINREIFPTKMELDYIRVYQKEATYVGRCVKDQRGLQAFVLVNPSTAQLRIYDLSGKLVADFSSRLRSMRPGDAVMKVMEYGLQKGVYVARLIDNGRCVSRKFVEAR